MNQKIHSNFLKPHSTTTKNTRHRGMCMHKNDTETAIMHMLIAYNALRLLLNAPSK